MALVKAIRTCQVGGYREAGKIFEYAGPPNANLAPATLEETRAFYGEAKAEGIASSAESSSPSAAQAPEQEFVSRGRSKRK
jgi:hypothetical protein